MHHALRAALLLLIACDSGPESYGDDLANPQVPARGSTDVLDWIDAGHYLTWACEEAAHPARPGSGHGPNRICSNAALGAFTGFGSYPVGAAGVKEIFDGNGNLRLFAVYLKVAEGPGGDSWYWYEGKRGDVIANGEGDGTCTGCHARAPQDFVYTVVR
mgnify:CR=1 FL=1